LVARWAPLAIRAQSQSRRVEIYIKEWIVRMHFNSMHLNLTGNFNYIRYFKKKMSYFYMIVLKRLVS